MLGDGIQNCNSCEKDILSGFLFYMDLFVPKFLKWCKSQGDNVLLRWIEEKGDLTRQQTWKEVDSMTENLGFEEFI